MRLQPNKRGEISTTCIFLWVALHPIPFFLPKQEVTTIPNFIFSLAFFNPIFPFCGKMKFTKLAILKCIFWGFPGGLVAKNPPCNSRDTSSILVQEDSTCLGATKAMLHNHWAWAYALERASRNSEPACPRACAPKREKAPQPEACALEWRLVPHPPQLEKNSGGAAKIQHSQKEK